MSMSAQWPLITNADGTLNPQALQDNFDQLFAAMVSTGGVELAMRCGLATLTFTASTNGIGTSVNHGLGKVPVAVAITSQGAPAFGQIPTCDVYSKNASSFSFNGEIKNPYTGTITVSWIALG